MAPETVALLGGLLFLLIAIVGGGFTIREIMMPGVPSWARVASLLVGVALIGPYFAPVLAPGLSGAAADSPAAGASPLQRESVIWRDRERDSSSDGIEVSGLLATSDRPRPAVGDRIRIEFSLRNVGATALRLEETFMGARSPDGENRDFAHSNEGRALAPGDAVKVSSSVVFDAHGLWQLWPCYSLRASGAVTFCPDEWRAFQVHVRQ